MIKQFGSSVKFIDHVADEIKKIVDAGRLPLSEIAVIYTTRKAVDMPGAIVPLLVESALERRGILSKWLSEDYRAKRSHDITANSVTITTIHSAKGLDFACVFLKGLDTLEPNDRWNEEQINSLAYVGITRARYQISIPYIKKTLLIEKLPLFLKPS